MVLLMAFLLFLAAAIRLEDVHDVIIIGAGIAGLGASKKLTDYAIPHLILQGRDRIGGRIYSENFEGLEVQLGANAIHSNSNNALNILMKDIGWKVNTVQAPSEHFLYQQQGELDSTIAAEAGEVHQRLMQRVVHNAFSSPKDLSVRAASQNYFDLAFKAENSKIKDTVKWLSQIQGNIEGADLSQLSAREIDTSDGGKDFMPQMGFQKFIYSIFQQCEADIHFKQIVTKIDYREKIIEIHTHRKKVYKALMVISSLPLGVLKAKKVQFLPELPQKYLQIIDKLGVGNMNKLFVSFSRSFWGQRSGWLNFVTKDTNTNKFPIAMVVPSEDKHILCFFLAGKSINEIQQLSKQEIAQEVIDSMQKFFNKQQIKVENVKMTTWDTDQLTLGSYSFYKVGTTMDNIIELRHPIDKKIWFVGEHTHPQYASMTHGAFQTGEWAAQEVVAQLKKLKRQEQDDDD